MINTGRMLVKVPFCNNVNHHMKLTITAGNFSLGIMDHIWRSVAWIKVGNIDHNVFMYAFPLQSAMYGDVFWPQL